MTELDGPDVPARDYHRWTDEELWDIYCWSQAKRRVGTIRSKAIDYDTTAANLGLQIIRARRHIDKIQLRLGKTAEDRERAIKEVIK